MPFHFKAVVTIKNQVFESPQYFNTPKDAEHSAAQAALMSLSTDGFKDSLLQQLAQKEDFCLPTYKTIQVGAAPSPIFFSTVEVEGEIFEGKAGKSKKQAEIMLQRLLIEHWQSVS